MAEQTYYEQPDWVAAYLREEDEDGYVPFNLDRRLGQNQYASRYADGRHGSRALGGDLRWKGDPKDYHFLRIHKDDLMVFHQRVKDENARWTTGLPNS